MAASKENCNGGYVVEVINEDDKKKFECMLCLCIIKKATHGCMNHVFCYDCLQEYIESNERKEIQICPAGCQQTFNVNELSSNHPHDQLINQIDCKCPFCEWKGDLLDFIQSHDRKCEEKIISCHLCGMGLKRKDMNNHLKNVCSHRSMTCCWCQNNFPFVDHLKHEESCGDIKVQCSFTKYGCNKEDTRRNIIAHETNSYQQHLSLMANYFTDENKLLRSENKQLKEETKQLKKLCIEESMQVKEENNQIKEKVELLEKNIKVLTWKVNISHILLMEPANKYFHFPAFDEMRIKNIGLSPHEIDSCFTENIDFTRIVEHLVRKWDVLINYKQELHELFSGTKTIIFKLFTGEMFFFQIDSFKYYNNGDVNLKKDGNIVYIENHNNYRLQFCISKWFIRTNESMMEVDITKPDKRFKKYKPPHLSTKYISLLVINRDV